MTDSLFFDSDCISAFLWVNGQSIVTQLYGGKVYIPTPVYAELSNPRVPHLKTRLDALIKAGHAKLISIEAGTAEYELYYSLAIQPEGNQMVIGKGEAASICLAKTHGGIVASNNLRDIAAYIRMYELKHITTGDIMVEAYRKKLIIETQGNSMWKDMLAKRRKIGAPTFTDYLKQKTSL